VAFALTLADADAELIHIAAIDGKTGANGRHSSTRRYALLNRAYRLLMSRSGQLGLPHGLANATGTLGTALAAEDFISLDIPATAAEVTGVDVRGALHGNTWDKLDPLDWEQRRDVYVDRTGGAFCAGLEPEHGVGFWATRLGPSVDTTALTQGKLAIWPLRIAGKSYTLHYVKQWPGITDATHVFLCHDGWDEWFINRAAMAVCQRDTNKKDNYDTAYLAWQLADADLEKQARRINRSGVIIPTPYEGRNR
jgi:hypothetical protein